MRIKKRRFSAAFMHALSIAYGPDSERHGLLQSTDVSLHRFYNARPEALKMAYNGMPEQIADLLSKVILCSASLIKKSVLPDQQKERLIQCLRLTRENYSKCENRLCPLCSVDKLLKLEDTLNSCGCPVQDMIFRVHKTHEQEGWFKPTYTRFVTMRMPTVYKGGATLLVGTFAPRNPVRKGEVYYIIKPDDVLYFASNLIIPNLSILNDGDLTTKYLSLSENLKQYSFTQPQNWTCSKNQQNCHTST